MGIIWYFILSHCLVAAVIFTVMEVASNKSIISLESTNPKNPMPQNLEVLSLSLTFT